MTIRIDLARVRAALGEPAHEIPGDAETRRAAVAAILRDGDDGELECLFIRRAERPSDPWSGHMAFPGGRHEERDPDLLATAIRETREEVGIDLLENGELLGRLDDVIPGSARGMASLVVAPYVWRLHTPSELVPNGVEVDEIHWAALAPMLRGEVDATFPYTWRGQPMEFPGYRVGQHVVWGMTHRMLQTFFARIRRTAGD